jgi:hypothetical protein
MMAVEYLDNGNDDGTNFGRTTGKIGFYGLTTPIAQQAIVIVSATTDAGVQTAFEALVVKLKATGLFA